MRPGTRVLGYPGRTRRKGVQNREDRKGRREKIKTCMARSMPVAASARASGHMHDRRSIGSVLLCDEEVILRSGRAGRARECLEGESCLRSAVWLGRFSRLRVRIDVVVFVVVELRRAVQRRVRVRGEARSCSGPS